MTPTMLQAGSNIRIDGTTDPSGQDASVTIHVTGLSNTPAFSAFVGAGSATNRLVLAAGNNIALGSSTGIGGMTAYISGSGGGAMSIDGLTANGMMLAGGNNVTLATASGAQGLSVSVNAASAAGPQGPPGAPGPMWSFVPLGSNITLAQTTDSSLGTMGISVAPGLDGAPGASGPPGAQWSFSAMGTNITLAQTPNSSMGTLAISIAPGPQGPPGSAAAGVEWRFVQGQNIQGSSTADSNGTTLGLTGPGVASLVSGPNISVTQTTNSAGTTYQLTGVSGGQFSYSGMSNITANQVTGPGGTTFALTAGSAGGAVSYASLSNMTGNRSTNTLGTTLGFSAPNPTMRMGLGGAVGDGSISGLNSYDASYMWLAAGSNVFLSGDSGGASDAFAVSIHARKLSLAPGANMALSRSLTNSLGTTVTLDAGAVTGGGGTQAVSLAGAGQITVTPAPGNNSQGSTFTISGGGGATGGGAAFSAGVYPGGSLAASSFGTNKMMIGMYSGLGVNATQQTDGLWVNLSGPQFFGGIIQTNGSSYSGSRKFILEAYNGISLHHTVTNDECYVAIENIGTAAGISNISVGQGGEAANGSVRGFLGTAAPQILYLAAGSNVVLEASTEGNLYAMTVNASMPQPGGLTLAAGGTNISISTDTNAWGTVATFYVNGHARAGQDTLVPALQSSIADLSRQLAVLQAAGKKRGIFK